MSDTVILLVDDEKTVLDALRAQIRNLFGGQLCCETAEEVDEAWEVLDELIEDGGAQVILVVSDWLMPGVRGDEFLAQVRQRYPHILRVMLTGQADAAALRRVRDEELAQVLLHKPWREEDLRRAVQLALGGH